MLDLNQIEGTGWCLIPPYIACRDDLSPSEKLLYGRIQGLTGKKGYCFATNRWLGEQIGIEKDTVPSILRKLKAKDLVEVQVIRNEKNLVVERRIWTISPSPMKIRDLPYENKGPSPMKIRDYSVEYSIDNSDKNIKSFVEPDGSMDCVVSSGEIDKEHFPKPSQESSTQKVTIKKERTSPIPVAKPVAVEPVEEKKTDPVRSTGRKIMANGGKGFASLLIQMLDIPKGTTRDNGWFWSNAIPLGKLVIQKGVEEERVLKVIDWLFEHHSDQYTPRFHNGYKFSDKFFLLEQSMKRAESQSRRNGNGSRQVIDESSHSTLTIHPNGTINHVCDRTPKGKYDGIGRTIHNE